MSVTRSTRENNGIICDAAHSEQLSTERDRTIDVAKGCGILLVIFGHVCHLHPFWSIIYSFHMPLFFLIAGINFHPEKYQNIGAFLKRKYRSMIQPYFFFCMFGIAYSLLEQILKKIPTNEIVAWMLKLPYAVLWMPYSHYSQLFNTPLWFVPCLLLTEIMFFFLNAIRKKYLFWLAVLMISILGWLMELPNCPIDFTFLPWNFSTACFALILFAVGNRTRPIIKRVITESALTGRHVVTRLLVFLPLFLFTGYFGARNSGSFGSRELNNGFLFILTGLAGSLCTLIVARFVNRSLILRFYGENSFTIMGCQIPLFWATVTVLQYLHSHFSEKIPVYGESSLAECIGMFLLVAVLSGAFTIGYNRIKNRKKNAI